jgi:hypothetical protein
MFFIFSNLCDVNKMWRLSYRMTTPVDNPYDNLNDTQNDNPNSNTYDISGNNAYDNPDETVR